MQLTWLKVLIFSMIPFADFILRVFYLNGTLDQFWTLFPLFQLPLFGFVPIIMMKLGLIKKGKINESPFDYFVFLFYILRFLLHQASECQEQSSGAKAFIFEFAGTFLATILPFLIRYFHPGKPTCGNNATKNKNAFYKIIGQSGVIYAFCVTMIYVIPKFQAVVNLLGEDLVFFLLYGFSYIIANMLNQLSIKTFCGFSTQSFYYLMIGCVAFFIGAKMHFHRKFAEPFQVNDLSDVY